MWQCYVLKQMVNATVYTNMYWVMDALGKFQLSTQEAIELLSAITLCDVLLHFFRAYQPPVCIPNSIVYTVVFTICWLIKGRLWMSPSGKE